MIRTLCVVVCLSGVLGLALTGCSNDDGEQAPDPAVVEQDGQSETGEDVAGEDGEAEVPDATEASVAGEPTVVARAEPSVTPTKEVAADPMAPAESEELPGIVVPAGAELVEFEAATDEYDARADYIIAGVDVETLYDWFREELPTSGWGAGQDKQGSIMFLHASDLSARFAGEGLKRTASVHFDTLETEEDEVSFSLVVEEAK